MIINHNTSAAFASRTLNFRQESIQGNIEKLSSGMRINRAGDDASGLAVSEKLRSQIRGLNQAERNIQNAVSFIQSTEGYLQNTQDILHRIRELSVQSANGIYTSEDRMQIQVEVSQLVDEVNRIASHAQFNGMNVLTGRFADAATAQVMQFQVGANMDQNERVYIGTMTARALGLEDNQGEAGIISISSPEEANRTIGIVDSALKQVNRQRADLGAYQNRFEIAQQGVAIASENLAAAESRIRDTDMASEVVDFVKNQILVQANTAMLAQANTTPQSVIQLLG
jgi:flagellin